MLEPGIAGGLVDHEWEVAHPHPGVATFIHVGRGATPELSEEEREVAFGVRQIIRVHVTQSLVSVDTCVETFDQRVKKRLAANLFVKGLHGLDATVRNMIEERVSLVVGEHARAFNLPDRNGDKVRLSSFKERPVLVYFYPKADTPGCTTQACGLRDVASEIGDAIVVGISPDMPEKLAKFDDKYDLGFPLLSDPDHATIDAYGAWGERSMYGRKFMGVVRSAVLIDRKGKISHVWPKISPKDTPLKLLAALDELG